MTGDSVEDSKKAEISEDLSCVNLSVEDSQGGALEVSPGSMAKEDHSGQDEDSRAGLDLLFHNVGF